MDPMYKLGVSKFLERVGLRDEDHTARNALLGGAAASPFLGLIGQRSLKNSPFHGASAPWMPVHDLQMHAQPGDMLLVRDAQPTLFRRIHETVTGSPLHHVEPVIGKHDVYYGTTVDVGEHATPQGQLEAVHEQRAKAPTVGHRVHTKDYRDAVLLRPNVPIDAEALANRAVLEARKPYSLRRAASSLLKDIFVPKVPYITDRPAVCSGHTCSTLAGEALHAGSKDLAPVVAGKGVHELLPADFARSRKFDIVGHSLSHPSEAAAIGRRALRNSLLLRAGLGAGIAGGLYGLSEEPELAASVAGAAAAPIIARRIAGKGAAGTRKIRPFSTLLNVLHLKTPKARAIKSNILRRSLPIALGGGLLGYLGAKGTTTAIKETV